MTTKDLLPTLWEILPTLPPETAEAIANEAAHAVATLRQVDQATRALIMALGTLNANQVKP